MLFFDFLYNHLYKLYASYNEKGAESTAATIVGGFLTMNVLTVIMLIQGIIDPQGKVNKLIGIGLFIIFEVYTYIRYIKGKNQSVDVIESKWLELTESSRKEKVRSFILYAIVSIISLLGLAAYLGSKK